jgi:hypothetical protein
MSMRRSRQTFVAGLTATLCALAALAVGCVKSEQAQPDSDNTVRHYQLIDRAVDPVAGEPRYLEISIPTGYLDTRILPPPPEGEARALFVSVPSSLASPARYFCRMTYSSPNPTGTVGQEFPVDPQLAPRFGFPEGFDCRRGISVNEGRALPRDMVTYYCEDPTARANGSQLTTFCNLENMRPTATCIIGIRIPSRAYLDCEYSPIDVSSIRIMANDIAASLEPLVRRPSTIETTEGAQ